MGQDEKNDLAPPDEEEWKAPFELDAFRKANILSQFTFCWASALVRHAFKNTLTQKDMWNLRETEKTRICGARLLDAWSEELKKPKADRSLNAAILRVWRKDIALLLFLKLLWLASILFSSAFALPGLIRVLGTNTTQLKAEGGTVNIFGLEVATMGLVFALCFGVAECCRSMFINAHWIRASLVGLQICTAMRRIVFEKASKISPKLELTRRDVIGITGGLGEASKRRDKSPSQRRGEFEPLRQCHDCPSIRCTRFFVAVCSPIHLKSFLSGHCARLPL